MTLSAPGMADSTEQQALSGTEAGIVLQFHPWGTSLVVKNLLPTQAMQVRSLVGELRYHMPRGKLSPHTATTELMHRSWREAQALQWTACALQLRPVQPNQSIHQC